MSPSHEDVEQAIRAVPGVASASIGAVEGTGRGRLRIRLAAGYDPDEVSEAVSATLRERFGIDVDPAAIRPRPAEEEEPDEPLDTGEDATVGQTEAEVTPITAAGNGHAARDGADRQGVTVVGFARPVIESLRIGVEGLEVRVDAILRADGQTLRGHATGAATHKATLRAVARATLDAVEQLFPGAIRTELESLELSSDGEDELATVTVTFLTREGADKLIGVSIIRRDPEDAIMRATLDAVNRRVGLMIEEAVAN